MNVKYRITFALILAIVLNPITVSAKPTQNNYIKPFILGQYVTGAKLVSHGKLLRKKLIAAGFEIVGEYSPYPKSKIYIITSPYLKKVASKTPLGGFGAVIKVSIVKTDKGIQISYNNPAYIGLAYNMDSKLERVQQALKNSVGFKQEFGGGPGIKEHDLPSYNYTFGLEGFDGYMELAEFRSFAEASKKVEQGLKQAKYGMRKVYRVDIPGKKQSVIGISMTANTEKQPFLNDAYVMKVIDHTTLKRLPHLPYEILIVDNKVIALHPHFRLAVNFPEMRMFGANSFGKLMDLPYIYEEFIIKSIGGDWPPPSQDW
jgi:hypothetical protein